MFMFFVSFCSCLCPYLSALCSVLSGSTGYGAMIQRERDRDRERDSERERDKEVRLDCLTVQR